MAPPADLLTPLTRLPTLQPGVTPEPWKPFLAPFLIAPATSILLLLRHIRELLPLQDLDAAAAEELATVAKRLSMYAVLRLRTSTEMTSPRNSLRGFARRFFIVSSLHCAAQAIGPTLPPCTRHTD